MAEQQVQGTSKRKLLIVLIVVAILLLGGGAAAYFYKNSDDSADASGSGQGRSRADIVGSEISYVNLAQPFVFNVAGGSRERLVQIKTQLMVRGAENEKLARYHSPLIESTLLSTFASATIEQLRSPAGRVDLRDRASDDIKAALNAAVGAPVIEKVLFTDFVIQ